MVGRGDMIGLRRVTHIVGQDQVVPQIHGVPGPGDEVVDVGIRSAQALVAVEAAVLLEVAQYGHIHLQGCPLAAEEELLQIDGRAQYLLVQAAYEAHPGTSNQVADETVELTQAVRHPRSQLDGLTLPTVLVQEVEVGSTYRLQLLERNHTHDGIDPSGQGCPPLGLTLEGCQRATVGVPCLSKSGLDRGLPIRVLLQRCNTRAVLASPRGM